VTGTALLAGVRVLDLTKATSGPFCTQILGDLGAEVLKVEEPPAGRHARDVLDATNRIDDMDVWFMCVNRNKRSVAIRLADPDGLALVHELAAAVDVVVDNYRPGVAAKLGVDHAALSAVNPRVVTCSLSGYGGTGPLRDRAGFDITVQAQTGMTSFVGKTDAAGRPEATDAAIADLLGGMYCAVAIPAALHRRHVTGEGCHIDVGMYDSVLTWFAGFGVHLLNFGEPSRIAGSVLWGTFDTKDRPLVITAHRTSQFERFCRALDRPDWLTDPRFAEPGPRAENMPELRRQIDGLLAQRTAAEWIEQFDAVGLSYSEVLTVEAALAHAHTAARRMVLELPSRRGGTMKLIGNPVKVDGVEDRFEPPPRVGEHTGPVLGELLGRTTAELDALHEAGTIHLPERGESGAR
jgi:crotonobetainyl-CoA:carnitine CoA-transferase CaiB-like acyl-CoA transferase